ncbi:hypothetical protein [Paracidovorax avenae]|uniref:hypothetical protein n=1 Tax=Paracidovorax avenae TaxID=80867 RepID=UPI00186529EA|nr:hypothetical protein [Paracidovorax avenae]
MNQFKAWARCRQGAMAAALSALFAASSAAAFQVLPKVSDVDRKISSLGSNPVLDYVGHWFVGTAIPIMKSPVHESITLAALECRADRGSEYDCVTIDAVREHRILLYGVRWPDDPLFLLNAKSRPPQEERCPCHVAVQFAASVLVGLPKNVKCLATLLLYILT